MKLFAVTAALGLALAAPAFAKSSSYSPGTGSKSSSTQVHGYVKKDGTYVEPHQRSTPDHKFDNNWSTKGNANPYTGKDGSSVTDRKSR